MMMYREVYKMYGNISGWIITNWEYINFIVYSNLDFIVNLVNTTKLVKLFLISP